MEGRERMKEGIATHTEISDPGRGKHQEWAGLLFGFLLNLKIIDAETLPLASQGRRGHLEVWSTCVVKASM